MCTVAGSATARRARTMDGPSESHRFHIKVSKGLHTRVFLCLAEAMGGRTHRVRHTGRMADVHSGAQRHCPSGEGHGWPSESHRFLDRLVAAGIAHLNEPFLMTARPLRMGIGMRRV